MCVQRLQTSFFVSSLAIFDNSYTKLTGQFQSVWQVKHEITEVKEKDGHTYTHRTGVNPGNYYLLSLKRGRKKFHTAGLSITIKSFILVK